ncbi:NAD(P)-dependent alcohol dehydrogenase [Rhodococcus triatomae]|nr:NAD(P)-dependent alcohol dehydrogenase [Rhodococcus triatomae]QNG21329.1 NAD(P)-dependent alcohol dehydrogenase [Rhodococcus triatomae]QNG25930.1 NAD(P)-dependent alcohol dehydrogenase [Rhodococcus triatomae]
MPAPGEVLVRIAGAGICHTDLTAMAGGVPLPLPAVLGHEGAGEVVAVGPVADLAVPDVAVPDVVVPDVVVPGPVRIGDRVVLSFDSRRACRNCRRGHPAYCSRFAPLNYGGTREDGTTTLRAAGGTRVHGNWFGQSSFATCAVASSRNAVRVPADVPLPLAGPLGCGIQTGAGSVLEVLRPEPGASLAVFGCGPVGLSAVLAGVIAGCTEIYAVDPSPARRDLAVELGATTAFDPDAGRGPVEAIRACSRRGVDYSVDTVSSEPVLQQALRVLASPGHCATLGLRGPRNPVTLDQSLVLTGRTLTGVIEGDVDPHTFIPRMVDYWREGRFPFRKMITTYPFEAIGDALAAVRAGDVVKAVLTFDTSADTDAVAGTDAAAGGKE